MTAVVGAPAAMMGAPGVSGACLNPARGAPTLRVSGFRQARVSPKAEINLHHEVWHLTQFPFQIGMPFHAFTVMPSSRLPGRPPFM